MKAMLRAASTVLLLSVPLFALAADPDAILGRWTTAEGKSQVEIFKEGGLYHGRIVALKEPLYPTDPKHSDYVAGLEGQAKIDRNNPDEKLRARAIAGMPLMSGFKHEGGELWSGGTIYDPENGKTYQCRLTLASPKELKVRGFIGVPVLGRTTEWTR
jgi:uncharacterized protein (DUF2147 family)